MTLCGCIKDVVSDDYTICFTAKTYEAIAHRQES